MEKERKKDAKSEQNGDRAVSEIIERTKRERKRYRRSDVDRMKRRAKKRETLRDKEIEKE